MITIRNLDLVRKESPAVGDALFSVQTQLNAQPSVLTQTQATVGAAGTASALPATPSAYVEIVIKGVTYVMPIYEKD